MPLHFWLPAAHANAPSHVSAMLSGVVLKMGIYGLVRMLSLLPNPPRLWGGLILAAGRDQRAARRRLRHRPARSEAAAGLSQRREHRHHPDGPGPGDAGPVAASRPEWIVLGLAGCLLHVWNHSFFKSLLFFCAGSVLHGAHTREIDRLGGLAKTMPWTARCFSSARSPSAACRRSTALSASCWSTSGLFGERRRRPCAGGSAIALVVPVLAMIGALAVACFVKVYGAVFLGNSRTRRRPRPTSAPLSMRVPGTVLAAGCILIGLAPMLVVPLLDTAIAGSMPEVRPVRHAASATSCRWGP